MAFPATMIGFCFKNRAKYPGFRKTKPRGLTAGMPLCPWTIWSTTIDDGKAFWACNEIVTTASWKVGRQMVYTGVSQYFDLSQPSATITPFLGAEFFNTGVKNGFVLQFEVRNYALGRNPTFDFLEWNTPFGSGAFGGNLR